MSTARIALANIRVPSTPDESVHLARSAVAEAAHRGARVICFPECFIPGERVTDRGLQITVCVINPDGTIDPANTFHEKAILCRAAENTCFVASVNCASKGSGTTSAIARPDRTLQCYQPYGQEGLLIADLDLSTATGLLASRYRTLSL